MMKVCKKCGIEKPLSDYKKYTAGKGGIRNVCVECERIRLRDWKRKNADRINEGRRERTANDPEYREAYRKYKRKYKTIHRERYLKLEREGAKRRYRENPEIREKIIKASKEYRENRSDEQIERDKKRYTQYWNDNKERIQEYKREWWNENIEERKEKQKEYYEENKDLIVKKNKIRYQQNRQKCLDRLGGKCVECGATEYLQFDHINPLEKSFTIASNFHRKDLDEELDKCQLLCWDCHMEKTKNDWLSGKLYLGISEERDGTDSK